MTEEEGANGPEKKNTNRVTVSMDDEHKGILDRYCAAHQIKASPAMRRAIRMLETFEEKNDAS